MPALTPEQIDRFWSTGVVTMPEAVTAAQLDRLRAQFAAWVEESRAQSASYGKAVDGRPRFDLQPGHSTEHPQLRRVQAPADVSDIYLEVMSQSRMVDAVADLIGPDVKHHHNKINSKLPGSATEVKWHQDFPFTPHTNTDLVTALLMIDDVTEENGPLEVAPGSHKGPLHSLWHGGQFTGAMAPDVEAAFKRQAIMCKGRAGSVCLMHTCVAHGSTPNQSSRPRTLYICVYSAADALQITPNPVPNRHEGLIVRGQDPRSIRSCEFSVEIPQLPKGASFFTQQSTTERTAVAAM